MTYKTRLLPGEDFPSHFVEMYNYMEAYVRKQGFPPSVRELTGLDEANADTYQNGFATSTSVTRYYLARMQDFGMIEITPRIARGIKLVPRKQWNRRAAVPPRPTAQPA